MELVEAWERKAPQIIMKSTHMIVLGFLLILASHVRPPVAQSNSMFAAIAFDLCVVVGFLMFIIGAVRQYQERNKK